MNNCQKCQSAADDAFLFCPRCGSPLSVACSGTHIPAVQSEPTRNPQPQEMYPIKRDETRLNAGSIGCLVLVGISIAIALVALVGSKLKERSDQIRLKQGDFGDTWPFTVNEAVLTCEQDAARSKSSDAIVLFADGRRFAINGTAETSGRGENLRPIWRDNPDGFPPKISTSPIFILGMKLCDSIRNGLPAPPIPTMRPEPKAAFEGRMSLSPDILNRIESTTVQGSGFFATPQRLCSLLASEGVKSQGWEHGAKPTAWCATDSPVYPGKSSDDLNQFEYEVGGYRHRADRISLNLTIYEDATRVAAKSRYTKALRKLFVGLGVPIPAGLMAAIDTERTFKKEEDYGAVSVTVWRSPVRKNPARQDTFLRSSLEVEIRDSKAAASARAMYRPLFAACLAEVLKHYGMSEKDISGDGLPTFSQDHAYFSVDWRKHTMPGQGTKLYDSSILCSVYPDGKFSLDQSRVFREHSPDK
jgi:hypothetical protein